MRRSSAKSAFSSTRSRSFSYLLISRTTAVGLPFSMITFVFVEVLAIELIIKNLTGTVKNPQIKCWENYIKKKLKGKYRYFCTGQTRMYRLAKVAVAAPLAAYFAVSVTAANPVLRSNRETLVPRPLAGALVT